MPKSLLALFYGNGVAGPGFREGFIPHTVPDSAFKLALLVSSLVIAQVKQVLV